MEQEPIDSPDVQASNQDKETNTWAMILHLSLLAGLIVPFAGLIAPVVIFFIKKDELPGIVPHGHVAFNWIISAFIYFAAGLILTATFFGAIVGVPLILAVAVLSIVFPIIGGIKASEGKLWPYPLSITFLK